MRIGVVSTVYNERLLLPQFLAYYCPQVDQVLLIDNESNDGSLDCVAGFGNVTVRSLPTGGKFQSQALFDAREEGKRSFIGKCDYVIIVDCDEFVIPKSGRSIRSEMKALWPLEILGTEGWQIHQHPAEPGYDSGRPLICQRLYGNPDIIYSKPILIRPEVSVPYSPGFHLIMDRRGPALRDGKNASFYLFHYRGVCEEEYVRRGMARTFRLSDQNRVQNYGVQYFDKTEEVYRDEFRHNQQNLEKAPLPDAILKACTAS